MTRERDLHNHLERAAACKILQSESKSDLERQLWSNRELNERQAAYDSGLAVGLDATAVHLMLQSRFDNQ